MLFLEEFQLLQYWSTHIVTHNLLNPNDTLRLQNCLFLCVKRKQFVTTCVSVNILLS